MSMTSGPPPEDEFAIRNCSRTHEEFLTWLAWANENAESSSQQVYDDYFYNMTDEDKWYLPLLIRFDSELDRVLYRDFNRYSRNIVEYIQGETWH